MILIITYMFICVSDQSDFYIFSNNYDVHCTQSQSKCVHCCSNTFDGFQVVKRTVMATSG